jgi:4-amino-4-deoxychorismate lyase
VTGIPTILVDGAPVSAVSALDRGFCYGDGLFETIRIVQGRAPLWQRHMERLAAGCSRLAMTAPDIDVLAAEVDRVAAHRDAAVVRITLSRGTGRRGYAFDSSIAGTRVVAVSDMPSIPHRLVQDGLAVRACRTRYAVQPALAGIKHLNRLEQVLARSEWDDPSIDEGLMRDMEGRVVSATAANLFVVHAGRVSTPSLGRCGVAGVARAEVLAETGASTVDLTPAELVGADEVFLTSSVRGILPVRAFGESTWQPGPVVRQMQAHWRALGFVGRE